MQIFYLTVKHADSLAIQLQRGAFYVSTFVRRHGTLHRNAISWRIYLYPTVESCKFYSPWANAWNDRSSATANTSANEICSNEAARCCPPTVLFSLLSRLVPAGRKCENAEGRPRIKKEKKTSIGPPALFFTYTRDRPSENMIACSGEVTRSMKLL